MAYYLGIDLGGTYIKAGLFNERLELLSSCKKESGARYDSSVVLQQIEKCGEQLIFDHQIEVSDIACMAIGVPGLMDRQNGISVFSPNFANWQDVHIKEWFEDKWKIKTVIDNDVRMHLYGEWHFGAGKNVNDLVLIALGTGLGSGIIMDGRVLYGTSDSAGELGHMNMYQHGRTCRCGSSGCLGRYVSATGMVNTFKEKLASGKTSIILKWVDDVEAITAKMISLAYDQGDKLAIETFNETGELLGFGLANVINLFNPKKIIISGGLANARERLLKPACKAAGEHALKISWSNCEITTALLGSKAGMYGAGYYASIQKI